MHEANTMSEVGELLSSSYATAAVIGIDGRDGVGKTTLAKHLGETIRAPIISVDDFVANNRGSYLPYLHADRLRQAVNSAGQPVIIEGVCLLAALEIISTKADLLVYVKNINKHGYWLDRGICDPQENEGSLIARLSHEAHAFAKLDAELSGEREPVKGDSALSPLREEIIRYHCQFHPSRRAQVLYLKKAPS